LVLCEIFLDTPVAGCLEHLCKTQEEGFHMKSSIYSIIFLSTIASTFSGCGSLESTKQKQMVQMMLSPSEVARVEELEKISNSRELNESEKAEVTAFEKKIQRKLNLQAARMNATL
jgi:hypothetical protein